MKGIFGIVMAGQHAAAHSPNRRTVPANKGCERCFVTPLDEAAQQLPIGQSGLFLAKGDTPKLLHEFVYLAGRHALGPPRRIHYVLLTIAWLWSVSSIFPLGRHGTHALALSHVTAADRLTK
ncbi:MAG TPA: hypothetical protein VKU02_02240 [Gemmataceae bacterium]|nr:hypothetical protein [Gemmataceae bacterium]